MTAKELVADSDSAKDAELLKGSDDVAKADIYGQGDVDTLLKLAMGG